MLQPGRKYSGGSGYRYGFNGQERDNEIYGTGNLNTAEYWEYDSRIGRRWNVDPKAKSNRSSYDGFSNNPIINIDPNGDDDFWSIDKKTGKVQLIKQDNTTTHDIRIQVGDKFLKLSELKIDWEDKKMINGLSDIVATYVSLAQIKFNYNCDHDDDLIKGGAGIGNGKIFGKTNPNVVAFFNEEDENMYLNVLNGKTSKFSDDAFNLMSSFQHENKHKEDYFNKQNKKAEYTFADHTDVYIFQMAQEVFSKTTSEYKIGIAVSAINHYLNAITGGESGKPDSEERLKSLKANLDNVLKKNGMYFKVTREFDEKSPLEFEIYDSKTNQVLTSTNYYKEIKNPSE